MQRVGSRADPGRHQATLVVLLWLRGFLLAGVLDRAEDTARRYRERCQDTPGPADVVTRFMCAEVARSHGQVKTAARWCRQVIAGIHGADFGGVSFLALVSLTSTLGMAGDATSARAAAQAAAAHTRQDRRGSAQAAATCAHRLAQACEGARTPALATLAAPLPLTGREREAVTLAAGGLSNRQIADRLVVSVRTVEGHLYRACAKLGASDRAELAALLHGH